MRFQKLRRRYPHADRVHLWPGGEKTESLVVPWLNGAAMPKWQTPRGKILVMPRSQAKQTLEERQASAAA